MACCNTNLKSKYYKSSAVTYSNTDQAFNPSVPAGGTALTFTTVSTNTGCAITPSASGLSIGYDGLYYIDADVVMTTTAGPGTLQVQLYRNGVALPCCFAQVSQVVGDIDSVHISTILPINVCAANPANFTVVVSSTDVTGVTVSHSKIAAVKLA